MSQLDVPLTSTDSPTVPASPASGDTERALDRFAEALGADAVVRGEAVDVYTDPFSFVADGFHPAGAVTPRSVEEVQTVVRIATELGTPLWTVSTGRNLGYGGAAPRVSGSVVLDLSKMDRVLEVDAELGYAIVEPGVRFMDLYDHLRAHDLPLWASVPDLGWGSLVGNALERGFGYTPYGEHGAMHCGMEVVLADGDVVRTGMGAKADSSSWALYKGGSGPSHEGLLEQSNLGIVTKMGVWLMPRPEKVVVCMAKAAQDSDLAAVVDTLRPLLLDGTIQSNAVVGNAMAIASMVAPRRAFYDGEGLMPEEAVDGVCAKLGIGRWNARFALYGDAAMVEARLARVRSRLEAVPGLELVTTPYDGDAGPDEVAPPDRAQMGVPSTDLIQMAGWRGGEPAHTDFSLVCPVTGRDAVRQMELIRDGVRRRGFDYAGGFTLFPRHAIALALVSFDRADAEQRASVTALFPELVASAAAAGYAPYRSHLAFMDLVAEQYDFNDHATRRLNERLKDALDPAGVLSPGKQGIWPAAMRG